MCTDTYVMELYVCMYVVWLSSFAEMNIQETENIHFCMDISSMSESRVPVKVCHLHSLSHFCFRYRTEVEIQKLICKCGMTEKL